ncbi:hypothetical protein [Pseudomonas putida]|uniref:hypothetical protein n=1 Tax=Pseudomonas putida TaxID=303 RepID=UPI003905BC42
MRELARPVSHDLHAMQQALQAAFGDAIKAILFYGSCLRSRDTREGLVDLYILVDRYQDIHPSKLAQWANAWLPPTVFLFATTNAQGNEIRAKCAILSLADFEQGTQHWFQSYLWARFAQASRLVFHSDVAIRTRVERAICHAVRRLIDETIALQPPVFNSETFWTRALTLTYGTELRPESHDRPALISRNEAPYLASLLAACATLPGIGYSIATDSDHYINLSRPARHQQQVRRWKTRRLQGRALNLARLIKALFTVKGGVDYAIWKVERHWGKPVSNAERLRRYPLIFCWPLLWKLLRQRRVP